MATQKSELRELARMGVTPVHNSGRGTVKGDGILYVDEEDKNSSFFTVDVKEYKSSYGVSQKTWLKIQSDAKANGSTEPMLKVVLGEEDDPDRVRTVVISEKVFMQMWEVFKESVR